MKRYLLFAGYKRCALGGVDDLQGSFDTEEQAMEHFKNMDAVLDIGTVKVGAEMQNFWYQILDTKTGDVKSSHKLLTEAWRTTY